MEIGYNVLQFVPGVNHYKRLNLIANYKLPLTGIDIVTLYKYGFQCSVTSNRKKMNKHPTLVILLSRNLKFEFLLASAGDLVNSDD